MNLVTVYSDSKKKDAFIATFDFESALASNSANLARLVSAVAQETPRSGLAVVEATNAKCDELIYCDELVDAIHHLAALKPVGAPEDEEEFLAWLHAEQK